MIFVLVLFLSVASEVDISLGKLYGKGGHHVREASQKGQSLITSRQVAASLREREAGKNPWNGWTGSKEIKVPENS